MNDDETPVFDFNPGETGSGIGLVDAPTFGATAMTVALKCDARDDGGTTWDCDTGGSFTEQGSPTHQRAATNMGDKLGAIDAWINEHLTADGSARCWPTASAPPPLAAFGRMNPWGRVVFITPPGFPYVRELPPIEVTLANGWGLGVL